MKHAVSLFIVLQAQKQRLILPERMYFYYLIMKLDFAARKELLMGTLAIISCLW